MRKGKQVKETRNPKREAELLGDKELEGHMEEMLGDLTQSLRTDDLDVISGCSSQTDGSQEGGI